MKSIKFLSLVLALVIGLSGCSLDTEMTGAALTQDQYDKLPSTAEGSVLGLYSMLYRSTSEHHYFGQKSIDMATDILSGDMAMTALSASDIPVVMITTMTTGVMVLISSTLVDIVTAMLDPRIRLG
jgi:hypothetical protein